MSAALKWLNEKFERLCVKKPTLFPLFLDIQMDKENGGGISL